MQERRNEPIRECCAPTGGILAGVKEDGCGRCGPPGPNNAYPCSPEPVPCFGIPTAEEAESFLKNCGNEDEEWIEEHCEIKKTFYDYMMAEGNVYIFGFIIWFLLS